MLKLCKNCLSEFQALRKTSKFCSIECKYNGRRNRINIKCETCGVVFERISSNTGRKYCSQKCKKGLYRDVTGQKFNRLTAISCVGSREDSKGRKKMVWLWLCDCGVTKELPLNQVSSLKTKSCGCWRSNNLNHNAKDIKGKRFGSLVVTKRLKRTSDNSRRVKWIWEVVCDCGNVSQTTTSNLTNGHSTSCGCRINNKGENNCNWKGGIRRDSGGYIYIYTPSHPSSINKTQTGKYVAEHRLVMEKILGRYLSKTEEVHHKNGIRNDNRPENLELWSRSHPRGARVSDLVKYAREILAQYGDLFSENSTA